MQNETVSDVDCRTVPKGSKFSIRISSFRLIGKADETQIISGIVR
jgi:hypothetical protein